MIDLSNRNKSSLQLILKELIRDNLDIEYKYLEGDDLTEYENEDLMISLALYFHALSK